MRVCSDNIPPKRRNEYSARQPAIPQNKPQPRTIARAIRFGNAAGAISMDKKMLARRQSLVNSIHARKFTNWRSDKVPGPGEGSLRRNDRL